MSSDSLEAPSSSEASNARGAMDPIGSSDW